MVLSIHEGLKHGLELKALAAQIDAIGDMCLTDRPVSDMTLAVKVNALTAAVRDELTEFTKDIVDAP